MEWVRDGKGGGALVYGIVALAGVLCLAGALVAAQVFDLRPSIFYRDPVSAYSENFAIGWLSNLGVAAWAVAATALLFTASLVPAHERRSPLAFGSITLMLAVDDLFLVHEGLLPFLGLPEALVFVLYGAGLVGWLSLCRAEIATTRWGLLAVGGGLLALSVAVDLAFDLLGLRGEALLVGEDAVKLTGILFWMTYGVLYARSVALAASAAPPRGGSNRFTQRRWSQ